MKWIEGIGQTGIKGGVWARKKCRDNGMIMIGSKEEHFTMGCRPNNPRYLSLKKNG